MTYRIRIDIEECELRGFEAVDECRRLGIPDMGLLVVNNNHHGDNPYRSCEVDEAFAREWFGDDPEVHSGEIACTLSVPIDLLGRGEVAMGDPHPVSGRQHPMIAASVPDDRLRDLFRLAVERERAASTDPVVGID